MDASAEAIAGSEAPGWIAEANELEARELCR
jgi:hypothetical protein